jgi:DNA-binding transcriptional ArsR family regulator
MGVLRMKKSQKDQKDTKRLARAFKALSNENRLELFLEILKIHETCFETECGECFITDIMGTMNIGAPTVSHHMKELSGAGLVITERKGNSSPQGLTTKCLRRLFTSFRESKKFLFNVSILVKFDKYIIKGDCE